MGDTETAPVTLTVVVSASRVKREIVLTTWGVVGGRYGSLGRVSIPRGEYQPPTTKDELARLLLTALYGLDYDL